MYKKALKIYKYNYKEWKYSNKTTSKTWSEILIVIIKEEYEKVLRVLSKNLS